ncbi:MAG: histidinol-phosphatase HisJ family protein [Coriobacteriia bacterium]|nr:histidinol-phosphatase HisJ family protein [Coriobacteriia bacterium]
MEYTDTHTHTWFSGHGSGTVEELVQAACDQGLTTIALTEHLPLPAQLDPEGGYGMTLEQVSQYVEEVLAARAKHPQIEVILGVEVDWREGAEAWLLELLSQAPYELVLGSVHLFADVEATSGVSLNSFWPFDHPGYIDGWAERGEENVWREYFRLWRDLVNSALPLTIMTHPDLPKRLGFKPKFDPREMYVAMAELVAARGLLIEVNTSGLHKPVAELYPAPALLSAFRQAGVGCTVSSDAHEPGHVGRDLDAAYAAMRAAGYTQVTVPTRNGDRRHIPLDDIS